MAGREAFDLESCDPALPLSYEWVKRWQASGFHPKQVGFFGSGNSPPPPKVLCWSVCAYLQCTLERGAIRHILAWEWN
jgi:hypothetical protein